MTCLADFAASNIYGKGDINYGPDDEKSYIKSVAEIQEEEDLKTTVTIKLKNDFGKMERALLIVIRFDIICKLKSQKESWE